MNKKLGLMVLAMTITGIAQVYGMEELDSKYTVYNNTPDAIIKIGDVTVEPNSKDVRIQSNSNTVEIIFLKNDSSATIGITLSAHFFITLTKLDPTDPDFDPNVALGYRFVAVNILTAQAVQQVVAITIPQLLEFATILTPAEKDSVKNWLLVDQRLRQEERALPKVLKKPVAQNIYRSLAHDLRERVIGADALTILERVKTNNNAEMAQLLENYLDLNFLEGLVRAQTAESFQAIPKALPKDEEKE